MKAYLYEALVACMVLRSSNVCGASDGLEQEGATGGGGDETTAAPEGEETLAGGEGDDTLAGAAATDEVEVPVAAEPVPRARAPRSAKARAGGDLPQNTARMRQEGATGASFNGLSYEADEDGVIIVPLEAAEVLKSHGFEVVG